MSYYKTVKNGRGGLVEIFKNPSRREVSKIASWDEYYDVRGFLTLDGNLFVWDSYGNVHDDLNLLPEFDDKRVIPIHVLKSGTVFVTEGWRYLSGKSQTEKKSKARKLIHENRSLFTHLIGETFKTSVYGDEPDPILARS